MGRIAEFWISQKTEGHASNEIYSSEHGKWVLLDPFRSIFATDMRTGQPLGVAEIVDLAISELGQHVEFHYIDVDQECSQNPSNSEVYVDPKNVFVLIGRNRVFAQDRFLRRIGFLPVPVVHMWMWLAGEYYQYLPYTNTQNLDDMKQRFDHLRRSLCLSALRGPNVGAVRLD